MGWVNERILDHLAEAELIPFTWDTIRDAVGQAVNDYNALVRAPKLRRKDCASLKPFCVRVEREGAAQAVELFLCEEDKEIRVVGTSGQEKLVCRYWLSSDRKSLEFIVDETSRTVRFLTAEEVCQNALEDYLFKPFPLALEDTAR